VYGWDGVAVAGIRVGDVNGDDQPDFLQGYSVDPCLHGATLCDRDNHAVAYLGTTSGPSGYGWNLATNFQTAFFVGDNMPSYYFMDLNGDHLPDLIPDPNNYASLINTGTGWSSSLSIPFVASPTSGAARI
jgi:hypothetical protein